MLSLFADLVPDEPHKDDLDAFAALPIDEVARGLEGAVLDKDRALRARRIAGLLAAGGCPVRRMADVRTRGERGLVEELERMPDVGPATAALVSLLLRGRAHHHAGRHPAPIRPSRCR